MSELILKRGFVTPNDEGIISDTDSKSIQNAVDFALSSGLHKVVIPSYNMRTKKDLWETDTAIILDSNLEIVLDNCYIRQMDGSTDNVFRNFRHDAMRNTSEEEQKNIVIRGVGRAVLDGGLPNGLTQSTSEKHGFPHVEHNNLILLHNLRDFKLLDFTILNQRWWAINLHYVEEGIISGLNIRADNSLHNQDGIDVRAGCNNLILKNLFGESGDDFIALTGFLGGREDKKYAVSGKSADIHDIIIRDIVATATECAVIALRNQDRLKIYNVTIDTVYDTMSSETINLKNPHHRFVFDFNSCLTPRSPYAVVRIGQDMYINSQRQLLGDTHSIKVSNIHARCNSAIMLNMTLKNSHFSNIYATEGVERVVTTKSCRAAQHRGADLENVVFENIFYNADGENRVAFDFDINDTPHTMKNVFVRNAFLGNPSLAINMLHDGEVTFDNVICEGLDGKIKLKDGAKVFVNGRTVEN